MHGTISVCQRGLYRAKNNTPRALSILEVTIVMVIIGVMAGITVTQYSSFLSNQRARGAVQKVKMDLEYAKNQARISSSSRTVTFDIANNTYSIVGESSLDHSDNPYVVSLSDPPYRAKLVFVDFNSTTTVTFDGFGVPDHSGSIVIRVGNNDETINVVKPDSPEQPGGGSL